MKTKKTPDTQNLAGFGFKPESMTWKRILVPLDFSESSAVALNYAIPIAKRSGGKLVLLHVVQFPVMPMPAVTGGALGRVEMAHQALKDEAKARLDELARKLDIPDLTTHQAVTTGVACDEIVKAAKRLSCDLIVMSTQGHSGLMRMLTSSTAEHVVRMAECPVLCVHR